MVTIAKTFDFDAAHFLPHVPDDHKCKRMHGHTYRVEVQLQGDPWPGQGPDAGMVVDYAKIAIVWEPIHGLLDHRLLNEIPGLENPTTEMLAPFILTIFASALPEVVAVRVYESSTTWCEARRGE
jgi:6-pyruvoyltetrahydropterin/6-carboxytetrahydropterin synthase